MSRRDSDPESRGATVGLLIVGMHRSGTSMVARLVNGLGLDVALEGQAPPMHEALPENPRGFFERADVVTFNDEWLSRMGGAWWAPPQVSAADWRGLDHRGVLESSRHRLDLFSSDQDGNWFTKDPRISLLLPLWDRLALQRLPVIVSARRPAEVAASLSLRDGMLPRFGLALWARYSGELLRDLHGRPNLVVDYQRALAAPAATCREIADFVAGVGLLPEGPPRDVELLVEPTLCRHGPAELSSYDEFLAESLDPMYAAFTQAHGAAIGRHPVEIPEWVDEALGELQQDYRQQQEVSELRGRHAQLTADLASVAADRDELARKCATLGTALASRDEERRAAMAATEALERRLQNSDPAASSSDVQSLAAGLEVSELKRAIRVGRRRVQRDIEHALHAAIRSASDSGTATAKGLVAQFRARNRAIAVAGLSSRDDFVAGVLEVPPEVWPLVETGLLDGAWYLRKNQDLAETQGEPITHYWTSGWAEMRDPSLWFQVSWYLSEYPDVAKAGVEPLRHYLGTGWREGRHPSAEFRAEEFAREHPEVVGTGICPLVYRVALAWLLDEYPS